VTAVIVLDSEAAVARCIDRLQTNWKTQKKVGRTLVVTIEHSAAPRSRAQTMRYWKILRFIAANAVVDGVRYTAEHWDEHYKRELIGLDDDGNGLPTSDMSVGEFNDHLRAIESNATGELGLHLEHME
jgi:hypothetical protein